MALSKETITGAYGNLSKIEDLFDEADRAWHKIPEEIQRAIITYHNDRHNVVYCLRWGQQAAEEIRKDWHTVVSETPCAEFEPAPEKAPREKEKFYNAGGDCYVMERSKRVPTTALIFRPCNTLTPYIVAIGHKPGDTSWEHGKYFYTLPDALKELESWDDMRDTADGETLPCPFCGGNALLSREYYRPTVPYEVRPSALAGIRTDHATTHTPLLPQVNDGWLMECEKCGARGPHEYPAPIQNRDEAVKLWNGRSGEVQ
jgi:hypothetical protein